MNSHHSDIKTGKTVKPNSAHFDSPNLTTQWRISTLGMLVPLEWTGTPDATKCQALRIIHGSRRGKAWGHVNDIRWTRDEHRGEAVHIVFILKCSIKEPQTFTYHEYSKEIHFQIYCAGLCSWALPYPLNSIPRALVSTSRDKCSQVLGLAHVFSLLFCFSVLHWTQTEEQKWEDWKQG